MMSKSRATISNEDLARIIKMFSEYLICWKVGLQYGSRLYFEMGKPLEQEIKSGVKVVGTSTLILEGYNWIISGPTGQIADSNAISPDITSSILQKMFEGRRLDAISFNKDNVQLVISFRVNLPPFPPRK
jgi:hypothetical protein